MTNRSATAGRGNKFSKKRWLIFVLTAVLAAFIFTQVGLSFVFVERLLHPACAPGAQVQTGFTPVILKTEDGWMLKGWWRPPGNGRVILLLPGAGGNRDTMLPEANMLARHGYGSLTLEQRNCACAKITLGYREADDVRIMLDYVLAQPGVEWVGALGFSAGGAALLAASAGDERIRAVIAEGNYANLMDQFTSSPSSLLSSSWLISHLAAFVFWLETGAWPAQLSPVEDIPNLSPRPVFLIYGEQEQENGQRLFSAAGEPRTLWIVPGAAHGEYARLRPEEYEQRLLMFFEGAFQNDQVIRP